MREKIEVAAFGVAVLGWMCAVATRCLPVWRVSGDVGNVTGAMPVYWDGVWMDWDHHIVGAVRCAFYQSLLSIGGNFHSWQALLTSSIGAGIFAGVMYVVGQLKFPERVQVKPVVGVLFILAGVLLLIPISWTTHDTTRTVESLPGMKRAWGEALYMGWTAIALFFCGGCYLCTRCPKPKQQEVEARPGAEDPFLAIHSTAYSPGTVQHPV